MRNGLKVIALLLAVLLAIVVGMFLVLKHAARTSAPWPEPISGIRLEPVLPILHPDDIKPDNAFFFIRQMDSETNMDATAICEAMSSIGCRGWQTSDQPVLAKFEKECESNLVLFARASQLPKCQLQTVLSWDEELPWLSAFMQTARCHHLQIIRLFSENEWSNAERKCTEAMTMAAHIQRGSTLMIRAVGNSLALLAAIDMERAALTSEIPPNHLRNMRKLLQDFEHTSEPLAEALRFEMLCGPSAVKFAYDNGIGSVAEDSWSANAHPSRTWKMMKPLLRLAGSTPASTEKNLAGLYSHMIDAADDMAKAIRFDAFFEDWITQNAALTPSKILDDPVGRLLSVLLKTGDAKVTSSNLRCKAVLRNVQALLAIREYQQEHAGRLPESLQTLTPDYLKELPRDAFAPERAIQYRSAGTNWVVWSIGPNLKDDGGRFDSSLHSNVATHTNEFDVCAFSDDPAKWRRRHEEDLKKRQSTD